MQTKNHVSFYLIIKDLSKVGALVICWFDVTFIFWGGQWCDWRERCALRHVSIRLLIMFGNPSRRARPHIIAPLKRMGGWGGLLESVINRLPLIQANNPLSRFRRMWRSVCCHHREMLLLLLMWRRRKRRTRRTRGVDQKHLHADKSSRSIQTVLKTQLTTHLLGKDKWDSTLVPGKWWITGIVFRCFLFVCFWWL